MAAWSTSLVASVCSHETTARSLAFQAAPMSQASRNWSVSPGSRDGIAIPAASGSILLMTSGKTVSPLFPGGVG